MSLATEKQQPDLRDLVVVALLELRALFKHVHQGGAVTGVVFNDLRDRAFSVISAYLRRQRAPLQLGFALPEVLLDGALLRASRAGYEAAYELGQILEELGGSELTIKPSLVSGDLDAIAKAMTSVRESGGAFESPVASFIVQGHLELDRFDDPDSPDYVAHAYAASVVAVRSLLTELRSSPVLPPRAKRVGQNLVDLSTTQLAMLLTAAASPKPEGDDATRAVDAAILAIAVLRQLDADRRLLSHVAMAALLCDVGDAPSESDTVPAHTVATLMSLGRLNEASVVRTVVAFETQWWEQTSAPVYAGRRQTTLAARVLCVVRGYLALTTMAAEQDLKARVDLLFSQCGDEVDRSLVTALAAAFQIELPTLTRPSYAPTAELEAANGPIIDDDIELELELEQAPSARESTQTLDEDWLEESPPTKQRPSSNAAAAPPVVPEARPTAKSLPPPDSEPALEPAAKPETRAPSSAPRRRTPTAQGDLATQPLSHVLLYALDQELTGSLVIVESNKLEHKLYLERGAPAQAVVHTPTSRLGEVLARLGLTTRAKVEEIVTNATPAEAQLLIGELLLRKQAVSRDELGRALEAQFVERVASLSGVPKSAHYAFYSNENLLIGERGTHRMIRTSPLNALFSTVRDAVDEERMMGTLKRIWRIPLTFHANADREAYALTGEEEAVFDRIVVQKPTVDELLADPAVIRKSALEVVYFLAITRQLAWKGQKKGPIAPRGERPFGHPPLPPRGMTEETESHSVRSPTARPVANMTPPVMNAVRLDTAPPPPIPAQRMANATAPYTPLDIEAATAILTEPAVPHDFDNPNVIDPAAALHAYITAERDRATGQTDSALRSIQRAQRLAPEEPEYAAQIARQLGDHAKLAELAAQHPAHTTVVLEWATALAERGDTKGARAALAELLAREPGHARAAKLAFDLRNKKD